MNSITKKSPDEPVSAMRRILIQDNGERLVDFAEGHPKIYWTPRHPVFDYQRFRLIRETPARMLAEAAERLPDGIRLAIVEGWRPPAIQQAMHAATRTRLRREHPNWTPAHLSRVANRFSAPMDRHAPPPHTTGGAVDLSLVDGQGQVLDFISPYSLMDRDSAPAFAKGLSPEAARNRALLREVLLAAGFTNYPAEWWHWSYGDQGWAYRDDHPHALYAATQPHDLDGADFSFKPWENPGL